jgi:hypothetical protein
MRTIMWLFNYQSAFRHIFRYVLQLFPTPVFSLYKKPLFFEMCQKIFTVLALLVRFFTAFFRLLVHLENNLSLYKFYESPASLLVKRNPFLCLQLFWRVALCVLKVTSFHTHLWIYGFEFKIEDRDRRFCWIDIRPRIKGWCFWMWTTRRWRVW